MSRLTVPEDFYRERYEASVAHYINEGHDLKSARELAYLSVSGAYTTFEKADLRDHELDRAEYNEEMSIGGQPYDERMKPQAARGGTM